MMEFFLGIMMFLSPAAHNQVVATPVVLSNLMQGDKYYEMSGTIFEPVEALKNIDMAINAYSVIIDKGQIEPAVLVKYVKTCDFKYKYLVKSSVKKKKAYELFIKRFEPLGKRFSKTKEYNYVMALLWGRRGEITQNISDNSNKNVAEKIKFYGDALYAIDKSYQRFFACKILGRVHYLTPNIPFILPWPDKNKSKAYLIEFLKASPEDTEGRMFLADTLWALGDTNGAKKLYKKVAMSLPKNENRFYDEAAVTANGMRMKELKIAMK